MRRHLFSLTFVGACLLAAGGYALLLPRGPLPPHARTVSLGLALAGLIGLACCACMAFRFRRRLVRFVRELLDGNYKTRMEVGRRAPGEIACLERMMNGLAEQLRTYDALRAERVRVHHNALETVLQTVSQPILIVDVEQNIVSFNAAACALFGTEQNTVSLRALQKAPRNKPLAGLLKNAIETEKVPREASVQVQFPGQAAHGKYAIRIVPVRGDQDEVGRAILFLNPPEKDQGSGPGAGSSAAPSGQGRPAPETG
jgi:PAS domain-containing protein